MTSLIVHLLAVMLLTDPGEASAPRVPAANAARASVAKAVASAPKEPEVSEITSRSVDFDGKEGVVMFDGDVVVRYTSDFTMCADRLYMFLIGTNDVSRIVANGHVSITNEGRVGTCTMAIYRRQQGEIEMFGEGTGRTACLTEKNGGLRSLEGTHIRFWIDSEQVEIEKARIVAGRKGGGKLL